MIDKLLLYTKHLAIYFSTREIGLGIIFSPRLISSSNMKFLCITLGVFQIQIF